MIDLDPSIFDDIPTDDLNIYAQEPPDAGSGFGGYDPIDMPVNYFGAYGGDLPGDLTGDPDPAPALGQPGHTYSGPSLGPGGATLLPANPYAPTPTGGFGTVTPTFPNYSGGPMSPYPNTTGAAPPVAQTGTGTTGTGTGAGTGTGGIYNNTPLAQAGTQSNILADWDIKKRELDLKIQELTQKMGSTPTGSGNWQAYAQAAQQLQATRDAGNMAAAAAAAGDPIALQNLRNAATLAQQVLANQGAAGVAGINAGASLAATGMNVQADQQRAYLQFIAQQQALDETKRQFDATYGLDWWKNMALVDQFNRQLDQNQRQFDAQLGLSYAQMTQQGGQFDQTMGFNYAQLGQQGSQFDRTFGLNQQGQNFDQAMQLSNLMANPRNVVQSLMMLGLDGNQAIGMLNDTPLVRALMTDPNSLDSHTSPVPWQTTLPAQAGPNVSWNGGGASGNGLPGGMGSGGPGVPNGLSGGVPGGAPGGPAPVSGGSPSYPFGQLAYNPMQGANGLADSYYDPTTGRTLAQMGYDQNQTLSYLQQMHNAGQAVPGSQLGNIAGTAGTQAGQQMAQMYQQGTGYAAPTQFAPGPGTGNLWSASQQQTADMIAGIDQQTQNAAQDPNATHWSQG